MFCDRHHQIHLSQPTRTRIPRSFWQGAATITLTLLLGVQGTWADAAGKYGFSRERLQRIDTRMDEAVEQGLMAGGEGLVARRGDVIYHHVWGMADREKGKPAGKDTIYRIYSMTKPVTSVALLMLYEEGHFLLNDPVAKYLPEFAGVQVLQESSDGEAERRAPASPPTIRDLLRHTAGLSYGVFGATPVDQQYLDSELLIQPTLAEFSKAIAQAPLLYDPGTRWHYSLAVDVQGRLIEVISGMSLGQFFQERIFQPLGMRDTHFVLPESKHQRLAQLYTPVGARISWDKPWVLSSSTELEIADPEASKPYLEGGVFESGGAGLVSTARDYLRFALVLLGEGELDGIRLLSPGTVRLLRADHLYNVDSRELGGFDGFGLGVGMTANPAQKSGELGAAGSYGWGGAAGTNAWIDPANGIVGIFMTQSVPHQTTLAQRYKVLVYQALLE